MSFKTKQKVQQWIKSFLQLTQIYPRHVLKSNFIMSALLKMENFSVNILKKTGTIFW